MHVNATLRGNTWILLAIALLSLALGMWLARQQAARPAAAPLSADLDLAATVLPTPKPLPPFTLTDHHGQPFTLDRLAGKWTFLFFGYTYCPDVCPTTLAVLDAVDARLAEQPRYRANTQMVFVSVDPERDSPERLARYMPYFNESFIGVTGSPEQIKALADPLGVLYMRSPIPGSTPNTYWIDHSTAILLVDPQARLHALFSAPHDPDGIAKAFATLRRHQDN